MSTVLNFKVVLPGTIDKKSAEGLLLSFFSLLSEISFGTSKTSALSQFYKVRLNKNEKRFVQTTISQFIEHLAKEQQVSLHDSINGPGNCLPWVFFQTQAPFLDSFERSISRKPPSSHQAPCRPAGLSNECLVDGTKTRRRSK